ncbi:MAG: hypothetical protein ACYDBB_03525 [Armatimonadota bacterium]
MALRIGFIAALVALYFVGLQLAAMHAPTWTIAALMGIIFLLLVAAMYLRVLPALLALPILAIALASVAGMHYKDIFTTVVQDGSIRLSKWIIAAILGSILAQVVEKTGIAQTAVKKTAELGGDRPAILAVLLTIVIALLFTTLGGLGAVIMVATIVIPILLSLGLRPLYVGCLFLLAMSLGGAFNLVNWQAYKDTLGMTNVQIYAFALPFAVLMLLTTLAFLLIEGKRMGKARYKAVVTEEQETSHPFVPWYALLTPIIPLLPVLFFALLPKMYTRPAEARFTETTNDGIKVSIVHAAPAPPPPIITITQHTYKKIVDGEYMADPKKLVKGSGEVVLTKANSTALVVLTPGKSVKLTDGDYKMVPLQTTDLPQGQDIQLVQVDADPFIPVPGEQPVIIAPKQTVTLGNGKFLASTVMPKSYSIYPAPKAQAFDAKPWTKTEMSVGFDSKTGLLTLTPEAAETNYDFPITIALLLGIIYGGITTWRKGQSTVQLLTKASFDGVAAVGPALILMIGIGMVLNATMSNEVKAVITPALAAVVPHANGNVVFTILHYVVLFAVLAPLALYRGPLNLYGMGAGLIGALKPLLPGGAIMGAFMSVGMIQGVCDPTNTHNVWIANYTNTDVQDILKRTLPYMWLLAIIGLILSALLYYTGWGQALISVK